MIMQLKKILLTVVCAALPLTGQWKPVEGRIMTRWAADVSPDNPLPDYPRPQLRRESWANLNGLWSYAITDRDAERPTNWDGEILVPFAVESALSGVAKAVTPGDALWYRRTFTLPSAWKEKRMRLHFGAVDWEARVWVNGVEQGVHRGGYTPFSFDVTEALMEEGSQEIVLRVWDPTDTGTQGRGKQVLEPRGIWYTAVTGIWQTVWLEPVGDLAIDRLLTTTDLDAGTVSFETVLSAAAPGAQLSVTVYDNGRPAATANGPADEPLVVEMADAKPWSPEDPQLYDVQARLLYETAAVDVVESYFAMRKVGLSADAEGRMQIELNNKPYFAMGPLDQGWWPDGLYTAPTDGALRYDIEVTKRLGFNTARKHVKVEPARWYYWADKLGLMVWQDMPSAFLSGGRDDPHSLFVEPWAEEDAPRDGVSAAQWEAEWREIIDHFRVFGSIVMWVPFNEGWGQYDTGRIAKWTKEYDPTRLVNAASGWTDRGVGDIYDTHMYPGPGMQSGGRDRADILGEFGGLGWPVEDHLWWDKRNWGYRTYQSREELNDRYVEVVGNLEGPRARGLAAMIYTQTTDVEGEVNGLMTYDREVVKFDDQRLTELHGRLASPPKRSRTLAPTSSEKSQTWRYVFEQPADGWAAPSFDPKGWMSGKAPLRSSADSQFSNGDAWPVEHEAIWARREFQLEEVPETLWLEAWHTVSAGAVYLNGTEVSELIGRTRREYRHQNLSAFTHLLKKGRNVLAIHAAVGEADRETRRDLDAGLYTIE